MWRFHAKPYTTTISVSIFALVSAFTSVGCGVFKKGHDDKGCENCGGGNQSPNAFYLDLSGALSVAIVDQTQSGGSSLTALTSSSQGLVITAQSPHEDALDELDPMAEGGGESTESNLLKLDDSGTLQPVLRNARAENATSETDEQQNQGMMGGQSAPRVTALGFSPTGEVYVLFERPFLYRYPETAESNVDPWSSSSMYTCQLFKSTTDVTNAVAADGGIDPEVRTNLECILHQHEVPTWQQGTVMQFSRDGKLYFPAHTPGTNNDIFYSYNPATGELDEKVNANICWRDIRVTPNGGIFYTGTTKQGSGNDCSGTSFFRYVSTANRVFDIARNWWQFAYESEVDPEDPANENILFYGPDPLSSTVGSEAWNSRDLKSRPH